MSEQYQIQSIFIKGYSIVDNAVLDCKEVTDSMFRTYVMLSRLSNNDGHRAFATMGKLGELLGVSDRSARKNVRELEKVDLVEIQERKGQSNLIRIKLFSESSVLCKKEIVEEAKQKKKTSSEKDDVKGKDEQLKKFLDSIITYFREKTGKNVQLNDNNRKHIKTIYNMLKKEYNLESDEEIRFQMETVIDWKTIEWKDDDFMNQYLRIQTLFAKSKFITYMEQEGPIQKTGKKKSNSVSKEERKKQLRGLLD